MRPSDSRGVAPRLKRDRYPYRLLLKLAPLHALKVVRYELAMAWIRMTRPRTDRRFRGSSDLLVNVGCGGSGKEHWVNVDCEKAPGVTCVYDCRRRIPLPTGSARAIFTEHLVEHLDYGEEAPVLFDECHRVLQPGGVLRVVVPDGRKYLLAYAEGGRDALRALSPFVRGDKGGGETAMEVINTHFRQGGQHHFSYDFETLQLLLQRCGFEDIQERGFGSSRLEELAIDAEGHATESLYVEAITPQPGQGPRATAPEAKQTRVSGSFSKWS